MKKLSLFLCLFSCVVLFAQDKDEISVLANVRLLHNAVFVNKDSAALENMFSEKLSYGHSGGKQENKKEAIHSISHNLSMYADVNLNATSVWIEDKTAITRNTMTANEMTKEGKINPLKLHIMLVWIKEKKEWKLLARQAVKVN